MNRNQSYWINTVGKKRMLFTLLPDQYPALHLQLAYQMKKTNWFVLKVFKYTKINLLAKDKFAWLRS